MSTKKSTHVEVSNDIGENESNDKSPEKQKSCFIIMPIADHSEYEKGHFDRVYEYLIKPACIKAGFIPVRADDSKASHMIMFDILKKIMECDMAICDLSSKNANVFYELGLRQAFNKKTILITDGRDKAPFDIAGFRYVPYSPSLRVDSVKIEINLIAEMLTETENMSEDDVNSIVKLLKIKPAHIEPVELNHNESMIFSMFTKLQDKIDLLAQGNKLTEKDLNNKIISHAENIEKTTFSQLFRNEDASLYVHNYAVGGTFLGRFTGLDDDNFVFENRVTNEITKVPVNFEKSIVIQSSIRRRRTS